MYRHNSTMYYVSKPINIHISFHMLTKYNSTLIELEFKNLSPWAKELLVDTLYITKRFGEMGKHQIAASGRLTCCSDS